MQMSDGCAAAGARYKPPWIPCCIHPANFAKGEPKGSPLYFHP